MATSSAPDSFLQKTNEELLYLVQHPELYHPALVAEAGRELRRRGAPLPKPAAPEPVAPSSLDYVEPTPSRVARWWPAVVLAALVLGLAWWGLRSSQSAPAVTQAPSPKLTGPIELEAVKTERLPDFEAETAGQVAKVRQQLPTPDRADTTATGRYLRMARRYWLAENASVHLIKQARSGAVTGVFPGQIDLTLERITWFMRAKAYNQHLTPTMEDRLTLMQQGLVLRRNSLENLKTRYDMYGETYLDRDLNRADVEASDIGDELLGKPSKRAPMQGNISDL
ncbi:hypothetical protein HNQ93_000043 [Hymenobacter luteus]|uniref:Uncharacterized protein n=2 Tax=Hymenobacter TaxID=89966 RepID=A0A7W9SYB4_9BACT|nr:MULTISPECIES: hypothetical protein [Hymenobacter]MBB4600477.1 hypothetical protein [Hymenobacter latericoloratus]MBB6057213.1 hypothetical protein [Hymenobacter luteus]